MRLALVIVLVLLPLAAVAQEKKPMGEKVSASGTIKGARGNVLEVVSSAGDVWQVAVAPKAEVIVNGTATPAFLRPGMLVKFSGKFNKRAETVEPLSSITVFTPREVKKQPGEEENNLSDLAKGLFQPDEPASDTKKPIESFDVSSGGAITSARGGKVTVRGPGANFKLTLAEDAQVSLDVSDLRLVKAGDKIELEGWTYQGDVTKLVANRVVIRLSETIGEKKK